MKQCKIILLMALLIMIPLAFAIDECKPVMTPSEAQNCTVTSTWNYTPPCNSHKATVWNNTGTNIQNYTFQNLSSSGFCFFSWNISSLGSYIYSIDTGDTGNIIVEGENNMLAIVLSFLIVGTMFFLLGMLNESLGLKIACYLMTLFQVLSLAFLVYLNETGDSMVSFLSLNFNILLLLGGVIVTISLLMYAIKTVNTADEGSTEAKSFEKWTDNDNISKGKKKW